MSIGIWQLVLILVIIFTLFGAGKLPGVMGDVGKGLKNLKDSVKGNPTPDTTNKAETLDNASTSNPSDKPEA